MRTSLARVLLCWAILSLPDRVDSSSFFPTNEEAEALKTVEPISSSANSDLSKEELEPSLSKEGRYIRIDDMLFKVGEVRPLSGFGLNANKWPNGRVAYQFHSSVQLRNRQR